MKNISKALRARAILMSDVARGLRAYPSVISLARKFQRALGLYSALCIICGLGPSGHLNISAAQTDNQNLLLPAPVAPKKKSLLHGAIELRLTERAQAIFRNKLPQVLAHMDVDPAEGFFNENTIDLGELDLDALETQYPDSVKIVKQVRSSLMRFFNRFPLQQHHPMVQIGTSQYGAKFSKLSIYVDEKVLNSLGKKDGAVIVLEAEVARMKVEVSSIRIWDMNNKDLLGSVGADKVSLDIAKSETPLRVKLAMYVHMLEVGRIAFEALDVDNNIQDVAIGVNYKKLVLPSIQIVINGNKHDLNNTEIAKIVQGNMAPVISEVRSSLDSFSKKDLPKLFNEEAKAFFSRTLEQVQELDPPGSEPKDTRPHFSWGVILEDIQQKTNLSFKLAAYVEDPLNAQSVPNKDNEARGGPLFKDMAASNYDVGLAINRSMINRTLQLAYERKNFEKIPINSNGSKSTNGSDSLSLRAPPVVDFTPTPAGVTPKDTETYIKIHVAVEAPVVDGTSQIFVKDKIVISMDLVAKLAQKSDKTGLQVILHSYDEDSVRMDSKFATLLGKLFYGTVMGRIKAALKTALAPNADGSHATLPGVLELPPRLSGFKFDLAKIATEPSGTLMVYMNFQNIGASQ